VTEKSIWSSGYIPNTPTLLTKAVESFPNGGRSGFLAWLKSRCTITNIESIEHHHGVDAVWRKFSSVFTILNTIIFYEPIFRSFMRRMMQQLLADGVKWIDLRLAFTFRYFREGHETPEASYDQMFRVFGEEIEKFKASEEGKEFWGTRMIWTGLSSSIMVTSKANNRYRTKSVRYQENHRGYGRLFDHQSM
jgi:adenosine deaminase CECR1